MQKIVLARGTSKTNQTQRQVREAVHSIRSLTYRGGANHRTLPVHLRPTVLLQQKVYNHMSASQRMPHHMNNTFRDSWNHIKKISSKRNESTYCSLVLADYRGVSPAFHERRNRKMKDIVIRRNFLRNHSSRILQLDAFRYCLWQTPLAISGVSNTLKWLITYRAGEKAGYRFIVRIVSVYARIQELLFPFRRELQG